MGLNENQKRAVEYLRGPLLVLAGPGTGKTQLLSHKVAYILENTDTNPENILCLTFTDTGAQNMRERLKSIIGRDALKVNIGTYHAFGSEILAQYRNYAPDYDRKLDSSIDEVTQFKIVKQIQEQLPARNILKGDSVKDIINIIGAAKSTQLSAAELAQIAEQNIEDSKVISGAISPLLKQVVPRKFRESYDNAYAPIFELLEQYSEGDLLVPLKDSKAKIERIIAVMARDLKEAIIEAEDKESVKPLSDWRDKYFEKDEKGAYILKDRVANLKLASVALIMEKYDNYLRENGLFDFNDMIEEAVKALQTDDGFRMTLQERYQFIMLDEFQDTNPSQFAIVKALTDYENPLIMAVGDDDQAIYEFQGAKASNLMDFQEYYSAEVIPLTENYRSTQEILDFSSKVIRQAPDRFADKELTAHKEEPGKSQIERIEFASADSEYAYIAERIRELIRSGVNQSQIAVISYKTKYFEPLLPFLKVYPEIRIAYEKRDNLFEDNRIHQILTILRYVHEVANEKRTDASIMEVLSYPFFHLPILEIVRIIAQAKHDKKPVFDYLSACKIAEITEVMNFLGDLVAKSFTEPLGVLVNALVQKMEPEITDEYERFRFYENLAALKGKVRKHFGDKHLKLSDLIEFTDDYEAAEMMLTVNSPYRDAAEAVQILSAHKAKGLEFEYVFVISADHTAWGKGKGNNDMLSLPKNVKQIRHTGTTDGEKLRVLYVALTRAKSHLIITNSLADFNGKSPERLEYFDERVEGDEVISPFLPTRKVREEYNVIPSAERVENLKNWIYSYVTCSPDMRNIYLERVQNWRMSATALTSFIDVIYGGPEEFFKSHILQAPREPENEIMAYGTICHKVFEMITKENITDEEALKLFVAGVEESNISSAEKKHLLERGPVELPEALVAFGGILRSGKAEVDFRSDKITIDGVPVTGVIDHLNVDEKNKTIEIYDFKTSNYHAEKWQSHATLYKYALQLEFYKQLVKNSREYSKYKIEKAHILFVVPDKKTGKVHDKVYDFSDESEANFLALMRSVYTLVADLRFLDDMEIFVPADNKLGLKDIKEFVALVLAKTQETR